MQPLSLRQEKNFLKMNELKPMEDKALYVIKYEGKLITVYKDYFTVSGMKFPTIEKAKQAIDKIMLLTKNVIG